MSKNAENTTAAETAAETTETAETAETPDVDAVLAENERLKAELEALKEKEKERGKKGVGVVVTENKKPPDPDEEEYVTVQLMYDGDTYKDDVYIAVNGEGILIKRGAPVRIKRKFAYALEDAMRQSEVARDMKIGLAQQFDANVTSNSSAFS